MRNFTKKQNTKKLYKIASLLLKMAIKKLSENFKYFPLSDSSSYYSICDPIKLTRKCKYMLCCP